MRWRRRTRNKSVIEGTYACSRRVRTPCLDSMDRESRSRDLRACPFSVNQARRSRRLCGRLHESGEQRHPATRCCMSTCRPRHARVLGEPANATPSPHDPASLQLEVHGASTGGVSLDGSQRDSSRGGKAIAAIWPSRCIYRASSKRPHSVANCGPSVVWDGTATSGVA